MAARLGCEATCLLGALLAGLSGCLGHFALHGRAGDAAAGAVSALAQFGLRGGLNYRFLALLVGSAMPMTAATAALIRYRTPTALAAAGSSTAATAHTVLRCYLPAVLFTPKVHA